MAAITAGVSMMLRTPRKAMTSSHTTVIGPNSLPTLPVPRLWMENSATMMTMVMGTTQRASCGVATDRPSTADSTEMAGVITASP